MIKIFADGADMDSIIELNKNPLIKGFTTNPSLMRKSGVTDYRKFAHEVMEVIKDKPVSFEVISDDFNEMYHQASEISSWGENVYVKIPITNTKGESSKNLIEELNLDKIKINITAITTISQFNTIFKKLQHKRDVYISIFAGRIADTGINPMFLIMEAVEQVYNTKIEIIWASPREVYNIGQADKIGCHIITCTPELISKYEKLKGKNLTEYSRETVEMFFDDAIKSGLKL
jgi:transaldolase